MERKAARKADGHTAEYCLMYRGTSGFAPWNTPHGKGIKKSPFR